MAIPDQEARQAIAQMAWALDGGLLGLGLAFVAGVTWVKYLNTAKALRLIAAAPSAAFADLRSLLSSSKSISDSADSKLSSKSNSDEGLLVVLQGYVQPCSTGPIYGQFSGERAVVVSYTQTTLYHECRGIFGWTFDYSALLGKTWKEERTISIQSVPFVLMDHVLWPNTSHVQVKLDGSTQSLPLTSVYHRLQHVPANPLTLFSTILGKRYPVALLDEEKILPVGAEITAIGLCRARDGIVELSSCKEFPFFLSEKTRSEIEGELARNSGILFWSGIVLGAISVGILGFAIYKNWLKFQSYRERKIRNREIADVYVEDEPDEDPNEVPDGQLCVICMQKRRTSAFVPCGHLLCCPNCALEQERQRQKLCPLCRQSIQRSMRIYGS